jgi:hypothetical protein
MKNDYSYILKQAVPTEKMRAIVSIMIPQMVRWAQNGETDKTYLDMIHVLNMSRWSGIGYALGFVEDVMQVLRKESGKHDIPSLNTLCNKTSTRLPSDGLSYVYKEYKLMSTAAKRIFVKGINQKAVEYEHWDWVLSALGLQPATGLTADEWKILSKPVHGRGGEGKEHKELKEYIKANPHKLGIHHVTHSETEHVLPSGDRLDVYFELKDGKHLAVEVKPSTAPEQDVARGIFQCVKYEATMKAIRQLENESYAIQTYLVVAADITPTNQKIADELKVKVVKVQK